MVLMLINIYILIKHNVFSKKYTIW